MCWLNDFILRQLPLSNRKLRVHEPVHRNMVMKVTNKMQLYRLIYYSKPALRVSGDVFVHHQEHLTVFTASGSIYPSCCRLVSWMSWNCKQFQLIHDTSRQQLGWMLLEAVNTVKCSWWWAKNRSKHVEPTRNNKLTCIVASCWLLS